MRSCATRRDVHMSMYQRALPQCAAQQLADLLVRPAPHEEWLGSRTRAFPLHLVGMWVTVRVEVDVGLDVGVRRMRMRMRRCVDGDYVVDVEVG